MRIYPWSLSESLCRDICTQAWARSGCAGAYPSANGTLGQRWTQGPFLSSMLLRTNMRFVTAPTIMLGKAQIMSEQDNPALILLGHRTNTICKSLASTLYLFNKVLSCLICESLIAYVHTCVFVGWGWGALPLCWCGGQEVTRCVSPHLHLYVDSRD